VVFSKQLQIEQTWDGIPVAPADFITLSFSLNSRQLHCLVVAPFYNDRAPESSPGLTHSLWKYEVVELFLLGASGSYLEIELGPHGHYLIYYLTNVRRVERSVVPLHVSCAVNGDRWQGEIVVDRADLPSAINHVNGYGIHGCDGGRHFLAASMVPGPAPDFHQPECFMPISVLDDWLP
jgi:hypothetical protein